MTRHEGYQGTVFTQDVVDLVAEVGPGDHNADRLYDRYWDLVKSRGRVAASPQALGRVLHVMGHRRRYRPPCWVIGMTPSPECPTTP